jgi:hypothetical protein
VVVTVAKGYDLEHIWKNKAGPARSGAPAATTSMLPRPERHLAGGGAREHKRWASRPGR